MTDTSKTVVYLCVAAVLIGAAYLTRSADLTTVAIVAEQGERFFPEFASADHVKSVKSMEVWEFDETVGEAAPFRVQQEKDGSWTIPSHHNYPADAEDRLSKTAGSLLGLLRDSFRTANKSEHPELGVVDPFEKGASSTGWGTRVKLFDTSNNLLVDLIVGKDVEGKTGWKYMRKAGEDEVYAVNANNLGLSTKFSDWIERDLLDVNSSDLEKITLKDYRIDQQQRRIIDQGTTLITKKDFKWTVDGLKEGEETNETKVSDLASALGDLKITGVREKPPGLKPDLRFPEEGVVEAIAMARHGYFLTQSGDVVSNHGELVAETDKGLVHTLRFGNEFAAKGDEVTAGVDEPAEAPKDEKADPAKEEKGGGKPKEEEKKAGGDLQQVRYMLVSVSFNEDKFAPIPDPQPEKPAEAEKAKEEAKEKPKDEPKPQSKGEPKPEPKESPKEGAKEKPKDEPKAKSPPAPPDSGGQANDEIQEQDTPAEKSPAAKPDAPAAKADAKPAEKSPEPKTPAPAEKKEASPTKEEDSAKPAAKTESPTKPAAEPVKAPPPAESPKAEEKKEKSEEDKKREAEELNRKRDERDRKIKEGQEKAKELTERYARWYYVVAEDDVKKLRLSRADVIKEKKEEKKDDAAAKDDPAKKEEPKPTAKEEPAPPKAKTDAATKEKAEPAAPKETPAAKPSPAEKASAKEKPADSQSPAKEPPAAKPEPKPAEKPPAKTEG